MYETDFYIPVGKGNNIFGYTQELCVKNIKKIMNLEEIQLGKSVCFAHPDETGNMKEYHGLAHIYSLFWGEKKVPVYIFDNHNHAYFFWHYVKKILGKNDFSYLYHIDEHADTRSPEIFLNKGELNDIENIFGYTNLTLNVGNYIVPAKQDGLIQDIVQIRSESILQEILQYSYKIQENCILNIDLDFFQPELEYIDHTLKKNVIHKILPYAGCVTIASSPFFIDQKLALKNLKDIFKNEKFS